MADGNKSNYTKKMFILISFKEPSLLAKKQQSLKYEIKSQFSHDVDHIQLHRYLLATVDISLSFLPVQITAEKVEKFFYEKENVVEEVERTGRYLVTIIISKNSFS